MRWISWGQVLVLMAEFNTIKLWIVKMVYQLAELRPKRNQVRGKFKLDVETTNEWLVDFFFLSHFHLDILYLWDERAWLWGPSSNLQQWQQCQLCNIVTSHNHSPGATWCWRHSSWSSVAQSRRVRKACEQISFLRGLLLMPISCMHKTYTEMFVYNQASICVMLSYMVSIFL